MSTLPVFHQILDYRNIFGDAFPQRRLQILEGICKENLIAEIAGINYRLKPNIREHHDGSFERQVEELGYIFKIDQSRFNYYFNILQKFIRNNRSLPLIFTRQTCIFALEEILQSSLPVLENFKFDKLSYWEALFKYLLAVNTEITKLKEEDGAVNFETLNPKFLPLQEGALSTNQFSIPCRAYHLFRYLDQDDKISTHFRYYIKELYNISYEELIYNITRMYMVNKQINSDHNFFYTLENVDDNKMFLALSKQIESKEVFKFLRLRKYPFYKVNENNFILLDNIYLVDKLYSQFINDFWFDYMKPVAGWNIKGYKSTIGYSLESYVSSIVDYCFEKAKYFKVKKFKELEVRWGANLVEVADVYVRYTNKVFLAQVKSTTIYDQEKYSGEIDNFYKNNREGFFESFGLNQLVTSVRHLFDFMPILDNSMPRSKLIVFPAIIVTEKALQTPLMGPIFQERFLELMGDYHDERVKLSPLSIIHISDLETIDDLIHESPNDFWRLLKFHCRAPEFMPPFYNSIIGKGYQARYIRAMSFYEYLINRINEAGVS